MYVEGILPQCVQITKVRVLNRSIGGLRVLGLFGFAG